MAQQTLEVKEAAPIVIETPCGFITIEKESATSSKPRFKITLPDACEVVASRGWSRATSKYVTRRADGSVAPKYRMLVPQVDESGALIDLTQPAVMRIERRKGLSNEQHVNDAVANGQDHPSNLGGHDAGYAAQPVGAG